MYSKLFVLMGVSWMSECVDVELHGDQEDVQNFGFFTEVQLTLLSLKEKIHIKMFYLIQLLYYSDMFKQSTHWICEILECLLIAYFCYFNQTIIILLFKCLCRLQLTHYYKRNSYSCRYEVIKTLIYTSSKSRKKN